MHRLGWVFFVLFLLAGCAFVPPELPAPTPAPTMPDRQEMEAALARAGLPSGVKGVCEWDLLGRAEKEIYVWAMCAGHFIHSPAISEPAAIYVDDAGHIRDVKFPSDGIDYAKSIRELFPPDVQKKIFHHYQLGPSVTVGERVRRRLQKTPVIPVFTPAPPPALPTPLPAAETSPDRVLGITRIDMTSGQIISTRKAASDQVLYARGDGSVILHDLDDGGETELLGPENYTLDAAAGEGYFLLPLIFPAKASPDGQWLIIPTQSQGTWLVASDGSVRRRISEHPLAFTWAPDSRRIAATHNWGQQRPRQPNAIFVQNVVEDEEERLLAELPAQVNALRWSPDSRHLAAITYSDNPAPQLVTWLVDTVSGEFEELCRYAAPGREGGGNDYRWSPQGDAFWTLPGWRICPTDGSAPWPLSRAFTPGTATLSPDHQFAAFVDDSDPKRLPSVTVRRSDGGSGVTYTKGLSAPLHRPAWTADSQHLVVVMGPEQGQKIVVLDVNTGELTPVAADAIFLGVMSQLRRSDIVQEDISDDMMMLAEAGPVETWQPYHLPDLGITLRAPGEWRVTRVDRGRYVIANFAMARNWGLTPLPPDALEIIIHRAYGGGEEINPGNWLRTQKQSLAFGHRVEKRTLAGRAALRVIDQVQPLSETWLTVKDNFEIIIERAPLDPATDMIFRQILDSIHWK